MYNLAFDTCFGACSVALWRQDRVAASHSLSVSTSRFERMQKGHAERLIAMVDEVLAESSVEIARVGRIIVTLGPGTFTGVRIGVAAARALALATGAEIVGVSSLHVMARGAAALLGAERGRADLAVAVDARKDELYFQLFDGGDLAPLSEPLLVPAEGAAALLRQGETIIAGSGGGRVLAAARPRGRPAQAKLADLEPDVRHLVGLPLAEAAHAPLRPLYLRAPDARPQDGKSLPRAP